jgi:hypothetical protein
LSQEEVKTSEDFTAAGEQKREEVLVGITKLTVAKLPLPIVGPRTQSIAQSEIDTYSVFVLFWFCGEKRKKL